MPRNRGQMKIARFIMLQILVFAYHQADGSPPSSPLAGKHLRVIPRYQQEGFLIIRRNASGFIEKIEGFLPEMLFLISERNHFTYSYLQNIARHTDDSIFGRGLVSYLLSGEADLALMGSPSTYARLKLLDYTVSIAIIENSLLIPSPIVEVNVGAIAKPYKYEVWILILFAIPAVISGLYWLSRCSSIAIPIQFSRNQKQFNSLERSIDYTIAVFCSQGAYYRYYNQIGLKIRVLAGCWCLACFVLVTAYNSVLISYILAPISLPIIKSIVDLPKYPDIKMTTEKGGTMETLFLAAKEGVYKHIGDILRANPYLSCNTTDQCVKHVCSKKKHVFSNLITELYGIINKDLEQYGDCRLTIAKIPISYPKLSLMLTKNSIFTEPINKEIQLFWESGLLKKWQKTYFPKRPSRCLDIQKLAHNPRISLNHLLGAFYLLLIGYVISCLVFIAENWFLILKNFVACANYFVNGF